MTDDGVLQQILKQILIISPKVEKLETMLINADKSSKELIDNYKAEVSKLEIQISLINTKLSVLEEFKKTLEESNQKRTERWAYVFNKLGVLSTIQLIMRSIIMGAFIFLLSAFYNEYNNEKVRSFSHAAQMTIENNIGPKVADETT